MPDPPVCNPGDDDSSIIGVDAWEHDDDGLYCYGCGVIARARCAYCERCESCCGHVGARCTEDRRP